MPCCTRCAHWLLAIILVAWASSHLHAGYAPLAVLVSPPAELLRILFSILSSVEEAQLSWTCKSGPVKHIVALSPASAPQPDQSGLAIQGVLTSLAGLSLESASAVNPALVRLQMVRALAEAWQLRWPALALAPRSPGVSHLVVGAGSGATPTVPDDEQWRAAELRWRAREAQSGAHEDRTEHARACQDDNAFLGRLTYALARAASQSKHRP